MLTVAVVGAGFVGYLIGRKATSSRRINKTHKLDSEKVVTMVDVEDIGDKTAYCRCWQSKKVVNDDRYSRLFVFIIVSEMRWQSQRVQQADR